MTMNTLFAHAPAEKETGPLAYLQAMQRAFPDEGLSGLVEIALSPTAVIYVLYTDGECLGVYHKEGSTYTTYAEANLRRLWPEGQAGLRLLRLPRQAVNIARTLIDWFPPSQAVSMPGSALREWITRQEEAQTSGLITVEWAEAEGILPMVHGAVLASDSIFTSGMGIQTGSIAHRLIFSQPDQTITVTLYEARPDNTAYQMLVLRQASQDLARGVLSRYSQLVGRGLTSALAGDLNHIMQNNAVQIQVVGEILNNTHVFHSLDEASTTYQTLFQALYEHTANVLGPGLARTIIHDTLTSVNPFNQKMIEDHQILSGMALR